MSVVGDILYFITSYIKTKGCHATLQKKGDNRTVDPASRPPSSQFESGTFVSCEHSIIRKKKRQEHKKKKKRQEKRIKKKTRSKEYRLKNEEE
uniref:Uncharacterized protein n=1 Tax=Romanomermis culicivorax TaxID=13658 RepID=A0A915IRC3_ROMCU